MNTPPTVRLNNDVEMPVIGFGTWNLSGKECERCVSEAINVGYRLIDTARMYQNEVEVGNAISHSGVLREDIFVTTKLCKPSTSYETAKMNIEDSLQRLRMDYIDLLLIHEPYRQCKQMWKAMVEYYHQGVIRAIGISNFNASHYSDFIQNLDVVPAVDQVEAHVYFRRSGLQKTLELNKTRMQAWSPLASGSSQLFHEPILCEIGEKHGKNSAQVALRYLTQQGVSVIPKSSSKERMQQNFDIFDFSLSEEEIQSIATLETNRTLFPWTLANSPYFW